MSDSLDESSTLTPHAVALPPALQSLGPERSALYEIPQARRDARKRGMAISDVVNDAGEIWTPERAMFQFESLKTSLADQDGKLRANAYKSGATYGKLVQTWVAMNQAANEITASRQENPAMWSAYDARQSLVAGLNIGDKVIAPFPNPETKVGSVMTIDRKFSKNWRLLDTDGSTLLVPPAGIRPYDPKALEAAPVALQPASLPPVAAAMVVNADIEAGADSPTRASDVRAGSTASLSPVEVAQLPLADKWTHLVQATVYDGDDQDLGQRSFRAFTSVVGSIGEKRIDVWNRWASFIGSTELASFDGDKLLRWMESNLLQAPWEQVALPGGKLGLEPSTGDARIDYWNRHQATFEHGEREWNKTQDRFERQVRDVEELGGDARVIATARAAISEMVKSVSANQRAIAAGVKSASEQVLLEKAQEEAQEAARYKPVDSKLLGKKPAPSAISGWFTGTYQGNDVLTNGKIVDLVSEPHLAGWAKRLNPDRQDRKVGVDRIVPSSSGDRLQMIGMYDGKFGEAKGLVYLEHAEAPKGHELVALDITFVQYFTNKFKGIEFRRVGDSPIMVYRGDERVGLISAMNLTGKEIANPEIHQTVTGIKAMVEASRVALRKSDLGQGPASKATAPEHAGNAGKRLDPENKFVPLYPGPAVEQATVDPSIIPLTMRLEDFAQSTNEFAALFANPEEYVRTELRVDQATLPTVPEVQAAGEGQWRLEPSPQAAALLTAAQWRPLDDGLEVPCISITEVTTANESERGARYFNVKSNYTSRYDSKPIKYGSLIVGEERVERTYRDAGRVGGEDGLQAAFVEAQALWLELEASILTHDAWTDHAITQAENRQLRQENSQRVILSLFDLSGEWGQPWADAGYNVIPIDIQDGLDVHKINAEYLYDEMGVEGDIYGILAATPCTDFANSGARHFAEKDEDGRTEASKELVFATLALIEELRPSFWVLENPVGRIERLTGLPKARMSFEPSHFGNPYTKKTMLWGNFNAELPMSPVPPLLGSKMHSKYGGKSLATKNARSETPVGFARAFFMANNYADLPLEKKLTAQYPLVSGAITQAVKAGLSERDIRALMESTYENDDESAAREALILAVADKVRDAEKLSASETALPADSQRVFRDSQGLNALRAPIEDKDWFKLQDGQEWQARQGYSGRGWSLVRDGQLHPEARNLESQIDFMRAVIAVVEREPVAQTVVAGPGSRAPKVDDLQTYTTKEAKAQWNEASQGKRVVLLGRVDMRDSPIRSQSWDEMSAADRKLVHIALNEEFYAPLWYINTRGAKVSLGPSLNVGKSQAQIDFEEGHALWEAMNSSARHSALLRSGLGQEADEAKALPWVDLAPALRANIFALLRTPDSSAKPAVVEQTKSKKPSAGRNLRSVAYEKNPFLTFLATHGLYHDQGKPGSLKSEFSPDKAIMVSGYGPVFKKTGARLDALTQVAIEEGYLPLDGTEQQLYSLVQRAIAGQRIAPFYAEGVAEEQFALEYAEYQQQQEDAYTQGDFDPFTPLAEFGYDLDLAAAAGYSELEDPIKLEVNALLAMAEDLGIDITLIKERAQDETRDQSEQALYESARSALKAAIAASPGSGFENARSQGAAPDQADLNFSAELLPESDPAMYTLTSPTREDVLRQQAMQEAELQSLANGGVAPATRKVTADQLDIFNTQASVFDAPAEPDAEYRYAMVYRPFDIGTAPKDGFLRTEERPARDTEHFDIARHGIVVYSRELSDTETKNFELALIPDAQQLAKVVDAVADEMRGYASQYVAMAQTEPTQFGGIVLERAKSVATGYPVSIGDSAKFTALVQAKLVALAPAVAASVTPKADVVPVEQYIKVAADSIAELRKVDVYRVLVESNRSELRPAIAQYIKDNRPDLVREVDDVLAEAAADAVAPAVMAPSQGSERMFTVIVEVPGSKPMVYPEQTGEKALANMAVLQSRGLKTVARTSANAITEDLTYAEMLSIYDVNHPVYTGHKFGDFWEIFGDDAKEAASILSLTLTTRNNVPMVGWPYHAHATMVEALAKAGVVFREGTPGEATFWPQVNSAANATTEDLAVKEMGNTDETAKPITPTDAGNFTSGQVVQDGEGKQYLAHSARHDYLNAFPIVDGKPVVHNESKVTFHLNPDTAPGYPERRHDPVYAVVAEPVLEQASEQGPEASVGAVVPESAISADVHLEAARKLLLEYTNGSGNIYFLAGRDHVDQRVKLMATLMGKDKVPQAHAGITAITAEFYQRAGIDTNQTSARSESDFQEWVKASQEVAHSVDKASAPASKAVRAPADYRTLEGLLAATERVLQSGVQSAGGQSRGMWLTNAEYMAVLLGDDKESVPALRKKYAITRRQDLQSEIGGDAVFGEELPKRAYVVGDNVPGVGEITDEVQTPHGKQFQIGGQWFLESVVDPSRAAASELGDDATVNQDNEDPAATQWNALLEKDRVFLVRGVSNQDTARAMRGDWSTLDAQHRQTATRLMENNATLVRALTSDVVSANEYPIAEVAKSYEHISHHPGDAAMIGRNAFMATVQSEYDLALPFAETDAQKAVLRAEIEALKQEYMRREARSMGVRGNTYSSKISGRGNLDSKGYQRKNASLDRAESNFSAWVNGIKGGVKDAVLSARNEDQLAAVQQAKDEKAAKRRESEKRHVATLLNFAKGDGSKFGNYPIARVTMDRDGYPSSVTVDANDLTDNKFDIARTLLGGDKNKLRALVDEIRAESNLAASVSHAGVVAPVADWAAAQEVLRLARAYVPQWLYPNETPVLTFIESGWKSLHTQVDLEQKRAQLANALGVEIESFFNPGSISKQYRIISAPDAVRNTTLGDLAAWTPEAQMAVEPSVAAVEASDAAIDGDLRGYAYALVKDGQIITSGSFPSRDHMAAEDMANVSYFKAEADAKGADLYIGGYPAQKEWTNPDGLIFGMTWAELSAKQQRNPVASAIQNAMPTNAVVVYVGQQPELQASAAAAEAAKRTRPTSTIEFPNAIVGPSGAKLVAYTWQWKPFEYVDKTGEDRIGRMSDWDKAEESQDTGREIVHQFQVTQSDGDIKVVSAESALALLGYLDKSQAVTAQGAISAVKTLARNRMELAELEAALVAFTRDKASVDQLEYPPVTRVEGTAWWAMGDNQVQQTIKLFPAQKDGELLPERLQVLREGWRANRMKERGWDFGSDYNIKNRIAETKVRVEKAQAKVNSIGKPVQPVSDAMLKANFMMALDGVFVDGTNQEVPKNWSGVAIEGSNGRGGYFFVTKTDGHIVETLRLKADSFETAMDLAKEQGLDVSQSLFAPVQASAQAVDAPPQQTNAVEADKALWERLYEGTASVEEFKAGFENWVGQKESIISLLSEKKKDDLLKMLGGMMYSRYKSEKKADVAHAVWSEGVSAYTLWRGFSYGMGKDAMTNGVRAMVDKTDAAQLAEFAAKVKQSREEAEVRVSKTLEAIQDPKTREDYNIWMRATMGGGKTFKEARLALTPEQRAHYDDLVATETRGKRVAAKNEERTSVRVAGQVVEGEIIATKHTKKGHDLFVVQLSERVSKEDYDTLATGAKRIGGYYSSYRGAGAIPGFQFTSRAQAEAFVKLAEGDNTAAREAAQANRDAFQDDRSQTAVERLTEMADRLEDRADSSLGQDRKQNTHRRAAQAARAESAANADKAMAVTMRNIAQSIEGGGAKYLDRVRQKVQVSMLQGYVRSAHYDEIREKGLSYEKYKDEPPTTETADYAEFPTFTAYRSNLASLARELLTVDGTKLIGQRLLKVADDVSATYLAFAEKNYSEVAIFKTKDGGRAQFGTRDAAEESIARSGYKGKAIAYQVKRGQHTVILSPSEAVERGVWKGDGDARLSLSNEFGAELVEKIGKAARRGSKVSVPWQLETAYDRRKALARMGIETPAEFRASLREFISLQERPPAPDKVKALERAMIGRRNDGMDFFPTAESNADEMVATANIEPGMSVYEPHGGWGHIAERIRVAGVEPDVGELSSERRELLEAKGFRLVSRDFLDATPDTFFTFGDTFKATDGSEGLMQAGAGLGTDEVLLVQADGSATVHDRDDLVAVSKNAGSGYDRILMNPPFSDGRDIQHVMHAYSLLNPRGRVVSLMGESAFTIQNARAIAFREWLDSMGASVEKLPEGSFMDPSLPVNTGANARMVVIDRPDYGLKLAPVQVVSSVSAEFPATPATTDNPVKEDQPTPQELEVASAVEPVEQTVQPVVAETTVEPVAALEEAGYEVSDLALTGFDATTPEIQQEVAALLDAELGSIDEITQGESNENTPDSIAPSVGDSEPDSGQPATQAGEAGAHAGVGSGVQGLTETVQDVQSAESDGVTEEKLVAAQALLDEARALTYPMPYLAERLVEGMNPADPFHMHLLEISIQESRDYNRIMLAHAGDFAGLEFKNRSPGRTEKYAFALPDASRPGQWRVSYFDTNGFSHHESFSTQEKAQQGLIVEGFVIEAEGELDRLSQTQEWAIGTATSDLVYQLNTRKITHAEFLAKHKDLVDSYAVIKVNAAPQAVPAPVEPMAVTTPAAAALVDVPAPAVPHAVIGGVSYPLTTYKTNGGKILSGIWVPTREIALNVTESTFQKRPFGWFIRERDFPEGALQMAASVAQAVPIETVAPVVASVEPVTVVSASEAANAPITMPVGEQDVPPQVADAPEAELPSTPVLDEAKVALEPGVAQVEAPITDEVKTAASEAPLGSTADVEVQASVAPAEAAVVADKSIDGTQDAGAELTYNKRNRMKAGLKWSDLRDLDPVLRVSETTKDKVYPKPDYQAMVDDGMPALVAHVVKQCYDAIAVQPGVRGAPTDEDLQVYIQAVNRYMDGVMQWATDKDLVRNWVGAMARRSGTMLSAMNGEQINVSNLMERPDKSLLEVVYGVQWRDHTKEINMIGTSKPLSALQPSTDEVRRALKDIDKGWPSKMEAWQKQGYRIVLGDGLTTRCYESGLRVREGQTPYVVVSLNVMDKGRSIGLLDQRFEVESKDHPDVLAFMASMLNEYKGKHLLLNRRSSLVGAFASHDLAVERAREVTKREKNATTIDDKGISVEMAERQGTQWREGDRDVTTEELIEVFGFKGVNFGNWMKGASNQAERQLHVNHLYDSFMDLSEVLQVPPRSMSLDGMLGIAVGAQGNGQFAAHFMPGLNEINITRTAGAGSVAHEWGHALDHFLARLAGKERESEPFLTEHASAGLLQKRTHKVGGKFVTVDTNRFGVGIRSEVIRALKDVVAAMNKRPMTAEELREEGSEFLKKCRKNVESWIGALARDYKGRGMTDESAASLNKLFERARSGDIGEGYMGSFSPLIEEIRKEFKKQTGNVPPVDHVKGLQHSVRHLKHLLDKGDEPATNGVQLTSTDFSKNADELDAEKGGKPYFATTLEKFARAFDAFVSDALEANGRMNSYLSHTGREGRSVPMGQDRAVITVALSKLMALIQSQELLFDGSLNADRDALFAQRVEELSILENGVGVGYTFWRLASDALRDAGGVAKDVDWKAVEDAAIVESIAANAQEPDRVARVLSDVSPGMVSEAQRTDLAQRIEQVVASLDSGLTSADSNQQRKSELAALQSKMDELRQGRLPENMPADEAAKLDGLIDAYNEVKGRSRDGQDAGYSV